MVLQLLRKRRTILRKKWRMKRWGQRRLPQIIIKRNTVRVYIGQWKFLLEQEEMHAADLANIISERDAA